MSEFDKELDTSGLNCPLPIIKAKKEIGYTFQIGLREGLEKLIDWRSNDILEVQRRKRAVGLN